ncbi:MAG TPA: thiamine phosphate synthase [Terriglobales bacterium]|nr:thiamine phosphate synthase [Terriglobales bacterium]
MPAPDFDLYLITDRRQTAGRDLLWVLEQALAGGAKAVQLREKDLSGHDLFSLAEKCRKLCESYRAALLINDRVDVAMAMNAAGVQLGAVSLPVPAARQLLGDQKLIGVSTHSLAEARAAGDSGADFIVFGPVYFTPSKASYGAPQGVAALKEIVENSSLPVYAVGGIKAAAVDEVKHTGIRGVALISAVMSARNPKAATEELLALLGR